jgi:hypothetical protein
MMPRRRSCDSMACSSSRARFSPASPLLGLFVRSLSTRRSAASTRSCARSRSARVYWRGSGRMRFFRRDGRAPYPRRIASRLTSVEFFVTSSSSHAPGSRREWPKIINILTSGVFDRYLVNIGEWEPPCMSGVSTQRPLRHWSGNSAVEGRPAVAWPSEVFSD